MSWGGLLAGALGGAANVIGKQAGDDIEQSRKAELMRQQADIEEQMRMRLAEKQESIRRDGVMFDNTGEAADAKLGLRKRELAAQSEADINKAAGLIPVTQAAARASAATADDIAKTQAGDKDYLKSVSVLKLADPEVRARIAASSASANASSQQVRESAERLKQLQAVGDVATKVRGIQSQLAQTNDPATRQAMEQQITDLGFSGKDIKSFLSTAEKAMSNVDAAMKLLLDPTADEATKALAKKQLDRANSFAEQAAALAGIKSKPEAAPAIPQGAIDELKKSPKLKADFESKFKVSADQYLGSADGAKSAPGKASAGLLPSMTAAISDPMKARADQETRELNDLKRTKYSPEVQAYLDERKRTQQEAEDAKSADYKAAEFRRAQAAR